MSKKSSKPLADASAGFAQLKWRLLRLVLAGVGCVAGAVAVGRVTELGPKLRLDVGGERIQGTAQSTGAGGYRLRYKHPAGDIYSRRYEGGFGLQRVKGEESELTLVFAMDKPEHFQPAGVSYIPAAIAGLFFVAGMSLVLHARHVLVKMRVGSRG